MQQTEWEELKSIFYDVILDVSKKKQDGHLSTINQFLTQHNQESIQIDSLRSYAALDSTSQSNNRCSLHETLSSLKNTINEQLQIPIYFNTSIFQDVSSLNQARDILINLENVISTHHKHALLFSYKAGYYLYRCKILYRHRNDRFLQFVNGMNLKWSLSHMYFLIKLYKFLETYPKFKHVNASLYFFKVNMIKIKEHLEMYDDEANFWKQ